MLLGAVLVAAVMVSCKDSKTETETETVETTDTVVIEEPAAATPAPAQTEVDQDGTSVQVGNGGVIVDSKDGNNSTNVDLNKDGAAVEIKK